MKTLEVFCFGSQVTYLTGHNPASLATGNFNNNRKLDVVVTNFRGNSNSLLLCNVDGTYHNQMKHSVGSWSTWEAVS